VFVVDDRSDAQALRAAIGEAFARVAAKNLVPETNCHPPYDPVRWDPVDWSVIVVRPSAPRAVRYVTAVDNPDLAWKTLYRTEREPHDRFVAAVSSTLAQSTAEPGAPLRLLEAFADVQRLVQGLSPPVTVADQNTLAQLDEDTPTQTLVASAADDQSPLAPADYAVDSTEMRRLTDVIAPRHTPEENKFCSIQPAEAVERIGAWLERGDNMWTLLQWPCQQFAVFDHGGVDCRDNCIQEAPLLDAEGFAACKVLVEIPARERCPEELGWFESALEPVTARRFGIDAELRVCEVRQLKGESLHSCQTDFSCAACTPGWCWTTVPELGHRCRSGIPYAFRFPHGADSGPRGWWRIVCD
jgi:hypothetical protein